MRLPHASVAVIDRAKITEYLLNREHPDNGGKADFFIALGFSIDKWENPGRSATTARDKVRGPLSMESPHGKTYIVDAKIETPIGKTPIVRTVGSWIRENQLLGW